MNIAQQIVNGIVLGSGYACIAIGWTILLGVARLVNFAHGQLYMLGAFVTWYAVAKAGLPYPLAIVAAMVVLAVLGFAKPGMRCRDERIKAQYLKKQALFHRVHLKTDGLLAGF